MELQVVDPLSVSVGIFMAFIRPLAANPARVSLITSGSMMVLRSNLSNVLLPDGSAAISPVSFLLMFGWDLGSAWSDEAGADSGCGFFDCSSGSGVEDILIHASKPNLHLPGSIPELGGKVIGHYQYFK